MMYKQKAKNAFMELLMKLANPKEDKKIKPIVLEARVEDIIENIVKESVLRIQMLNKGNLK
jgi:hypothetical protein